MLFGFWVILCFAFQSLKSTGPLAKTVLFILYAVVKRKLHFNETSVLEEMKTCPEQRYAHNSGII